MTMQTAKKHPLEARYPLRGWDGYEMDRDFVRKYVVDKINEEMAVSEFSHQWLNGLEIVDNTDKQVSPLNANKVIKITFDVAWVTNPDDDSTIISANDNPLPDDTDFSNLDYYFYRTTFFAPVSKIAFKKLYGFARTLSKRGFLSLTNNDSGEITEIMSELNLILHFGSETEGVR